MREGEVKKQGLNYSAVLYKANTSLIASRFEVDARVVSVQLLYDYLI